MVRSTSSRFARTSALAAVTLVVALGGLAGCSSGGGGCPQSILDKIAEQEAQGVSVRVGSVSEFPVEEVRGLLPGACVVVTSTTPANAGDLYLAVAPLGVSAETLADAATGAGFEWIDLGGEGPYGNYVRDSDPAKAPRSEYLFLQEVDAAFNEDLYATFEEGRVAVMFTEAELSVD